MALSTEDITAFIDMLQGDKHVKNKAISAFMQEIGLGSHLPRVLSNIVLDYLGVDPKQDKIYIRIYFPADILAKIKVQALKEENKGTPILELLLKQVTKFEIFQHLKTAKKAKPTESAEETHMVLTVPTVPQDNYFVQPDFYEATKYASTFKSLLTTEDVAEVLVFNRTKWEEIQNLHQDKLGANYISWHRLVQTNTQIAENPKFALPGSKTAALAASMDKVFKYFHPTVAEKTVDSAPNRSESPRRLMQ